MTSSLYAIVGLRTEGLDVRVDSVLMPGEQTDINATMLQFRGLVNRDLRVIQIEIETDDTSDILAERLGKLQQHELADLYRDGVRL